MSTHSHAKRVAGERERMYLQGVSHRRFGLAKYYSSHPYQDDYNDGWHGRRFNRPGRRSITDRIRRAFYELFGF